MSLTNLHSAPFCLPIAVAAWLFFLNCAPSAMARERQHPVMATSADDARLCNQLIALSPTVSQDEARRVVRCAYNTGVELRREWQVVWPPGLQVVLANTGKKKGGLCYQWATELLLRLDSMKLQTLEAHWAESFANSLANTMSSLSPPKASPLSKAFCLITGVWRTPRLRPCLCGFRVQMDGKQWGGCPPRENEIDFGLGSWRPVVSREIMRTAHAVKDHRCER
jgi:hypothetical protein